MNSISFYGGESCGSIGSKINTSKQECAGSVGVREQEPEIKLQTLDKDTVCFRGQDENSTKKKSSVFGTLLCTGAAAAIIIGGLGYAHKNKIADKIKNKTIKKYFNVVAEPCYKACAKTKGYAIKGYDKVKGFFSGKK